MKQHVLDEAEASLETQFLMVQPRLLNWTDTRSQAHRRRVCKRTSQFSADASLAVLYECTLRHDSGGKSRVRRVLAERSDSARKAVPAVSRLAAANIPSGTPPARPAATTTTWLVWTSLASNSLGRYELPGETENGFWRRGCHADHTVSFFPVAFLSH